MIKVTNFFKRASALVVLVSVSAASFAADTAGVTSALTEAGTAIGVVGAAVLVVVVGTKVFKWIARAL
jgi:hypothetical protein